MSETLKRALELVATALLITAYRPDPQRWAGDFLRRI